jgi:hypothetical protein
MLRLHFAGSVLELPWRIGEDCAVLPAGEALQQVSIRLRGRHLSVPDVKLLSDPENEQRTAAASAAEDARPKLAHMSRGLTVTRSPPKPGEYQPQGVCARYDDSDADGPQIAQEAEIVEVAIVERILVVPFDFERDPVLETINLVRRRFYRYVIDNNPRLKLLLDPASRMKPRSISSASLDFRPPPTEIQLRRKRNAVKTSTTLRHSFEKSLFRMAQACFHSWHS